MSTTLTPRSPWNGRRVALCVAGGVAAYKTAQLARDLTQLGARVDVVLSRSAPQFVTALTYEALTGRPAHHDAFRMGGAALHIEIAREADVVCVAPATADLIARHAAGMADDLVASVLLATRAPVVMCPAMNPRMWTHPATIRNVALLREQFGHEIVGPDEGPLGYGEEAGVGRMVEPALILEHIGRALARGGALDGRRVVVTAGPTREPVDAVRVLSNRSSGRMGYAIAAEAWRRGADVTLISGPSARPAPAGVELIGVQTAEEMRSAVREAIHDADGVGDAAAAELAYDAIHGRSFTCFDAPFQERGFLASRCPTALASPQSWPLSYPLDTGFDAPVASAATKRAAWKRLRAPSRRRPD